MAEYAIITNHTNYGMELINQNPDAITNLAVKANNDVKNATGGNYGISNVYIDFEGKTTYYDLEPLSVSAKAEMQQASLGMPSIGFWETIKKIITVIVAVATFVIGAILAGGWGALAGAIIGGAILLYSYLTSKIEYKQDMVEIDDEYARQLRDGEITQTQYNEFTAMKHTSMEEEGISWKMIVIGGLVGAGILGAIYIITRKGK